MSSKVLFIKYVPHFLQVDSTAQQKSLIAAANCTSSHGVLLNTKGGCLSIEGFPDIPCSEKHKSWSLFKEAVKQLLGVPQQTSISLRFSYPPCSPIASVSEILQESSHIVQLIATPLPHTNPLVTLRIPVPQSRSYRQRTDGSRTTKTDPYCQYKEVFGSSVPSVIERKCNFPDMERLLSQLEEVSQSLERTQRACDKIARKESPSLRPAVVPAPCDKILLCASDSGNGPSLAEDQTDGMDDLELHSEDENVEKLLKIAETIVKMPPPPPPRKEREVVPVRLTDDEGVCLPDPPTGVTVQPSITEGGIYVLWNPVRLDGDDSNHGHTVLGYKVHLDKRLRVNVSGSLSSQAELLGDQLEEGQEYTVQVCTHTNHCNSLLSTPLKYRHCRRPSKQAHLNKTRVEQEKESQSKAARVESWLLNGHISQTDAHTLANGIQGLSERSSSSPSHHVHFGRVGYNKWAESDVDIPAHLMDSGCEDTRSNASSHTSGIVTDFPASPYVKQQTPSFSYYSQHTDAHSTHSISTHLSNVHSASDDGFHTLTRSSLSEQHAKLSLSSTLCPSNRTSCAGSTELSCLAASDTIIDEPMELSPARRLMSSTNEIDGRTSRGRLLRMKQKKPEAPEQLSVKQDPEERRWLILEWTPASRNSKGCSNGFFILGYRIYVNDVAHSSVNGAMTYRARIACPTNSSDPIKLDVRSRAMAGESCSSNSVHFNTNTHQPTTSACHSVMSNSCTVRCSSAASAATFKSGTSSRTIQPRSLRVETIV